MSGNENSRFTDTDNQRALAAYIEKFRRSSKAAEEFLSFLRRSDAGVWRVEADRIPSRWWLNVTLANNQKNIFDLHREIQVLFTEYEHVEPRTLSVIQARVRRDMRVEPDLAIIVSRDPTVTQTTRRRAGEMALIAVDLEEVRDGASPPLHTLIARAVSTVDHYNVTTPVQDPSGFYGRDAEIDSIASDIQRAVSVGVFGLRKAGKTSLLNAIKGTRDTARGDITVTLDFSAIVSPGQFRFAILEGFWAAINDATGAQRFRPRLLTLNREGLRKTHDQDPSDNWIQDLKTMLEFTDSPALLVIDEIDQAFPPRSSLDLDDAAGIFRALVQLRSLIQEQHKLVLLCAGVDPALFERPLIDGKDNLLYKLIRLVWLAPMPKEEMAHMIRSLGRRMGVRIRGHEEISMLFAEYGGHPLLTRKACSLAASERTAETLPFHITKTTLGSAFTSTKYEGPRRQAADVLASFTEWFPDEAALMRLYYAENEEERLVAQELLDEDPDSLLHAIEYGLFFRDRKPRISAALAHLKSQ
ncbi:nSTAND1 domain-containing NTPase [Clavibacter nebraskensis]